jgi:hypothetical protein
MSGEELHEIMCDDSRPCARWLGGNSSHRDYYRDRAAELTARLAPEIGAANVKLAVQAVTEVML